MLTLHVVSMVLNATVNTFKDSNVFTNIFWFLDVHKTQY
jgi:hypothetical protein